MIEESVRASSGRAHVRLPYVGPALTELWVTAWVHADPVRSSGELVRRCGTCETEFWELSGAERWDSRLDSERRNSVRTKTTRLPNAGLFVRSADLSGDSLFRVFEFPGWVLCTDPVREFVTQRGFSNVEFLEMGETY